ncbi:hypothetical protein [Streptomyces morookaense]|uniref:Uncharacterized protein n=1 Tax=Streptomyces morookaense TaxID=1970 RepID=A0A7Y7BAX5_STRMO|nr:hypothetical protein [Streptomyces morookaense]NVK82267.1 hypothetical protein [Streptomyces morookaense]GHF53539.1 hypothetical protein GCM10010359_64830 [Streptomyces morookaense]
MGKPQRPHTPRRAWPAMALRALLLAAAVCGLVLCVPWVQESYRNSVTYRHAAPCPPDHRTRTAGNCIEQATARVVDKDIDESCTTDSNGVRSCTETYELRLALAGRETWHEVEWPTYRDAHPGDSAEVRSWHGAVVRMALNGHTETYFAPAEKSLFWRLAGAWGLLGVAVGAAAGPRLLLRPPYMIGWLLLTLPVLALVGDALLGYASPLERAVDSALAVPGLCVLAVALRRRRRTADWGASRFS